VLFEGTRCLLLNRLMSAVLGEEAIHMLLYRRWTVGMLKMGPPWTKWVEGRGNDWSMRVVRIAFADQEVPYGGIEGGM
jgi:hypothetical protein